jgi:hypothetical protein
MGFYFRKSAKVGPFRINYSKSGVGMSVGVKGLRVGKGPRGNYIHMTGPAGIQYRQSLNSNVKQNTKSEPAPQPSASLDDYVLIDHGSVAEMRDVDFDDILNEINYKYSVKNPGVIGIILAFIILIILFSTGAGGISLLVFLAITVLSIIWINAIESKKTTYLIYNLDEEQEGKAGKLYSALDELKNCSAKWVVLGNRFFDRNEAKQHGNIEKSIAITVTAINYKLPKYVASNVTPLEILTGQKSSMYFFPDRVLIKNKETFGTVNYSNFRINLEEQPIMEMGMVPADATIIEKVWKYAKKDGGPDARYKDNVQFPICAYTLISFNSDTGLNVTIQVSKRNSGQQLSELFSGDFFKVNIKQVDHKEKSSYDDVIQKEPAVYQNSSKETVEEVLLNNQALSLESGNEAKSWQTALLLCIFLGWLGVHRFYVGKAGTGLLMLFTLGGLGVWALIDFILICCGKFTDKQGNKLSKNY